MHVKHVSTAHIHVPVTHTYLQCFSTLLLRAIFSPTSVHTGWVSAILAKSAFTALTLPPVDSDPMLTISTSLRDSFCTCRVYTSTTCSKDYVAKYTYVCIATYYTHIR